MLRGVSRDPKQFLKMVPGQKWKPDIVFFHFWNKKRKVYKLLDFKELSPTYKVSLSEKCPNTKFFLVRIFLYSDWIHSVRIQENMDQKKLRIWTLFTQCF